MALECSPELLALEALLLSIEELFEQSIIRSCHTTTYSTNVCRHMKNSASTLVYPEYIRNISFKHITNTL